MLSSNSCLRLGPKSPCSSSPGSLAETVVSCASVCWGGPSAGSSDAIAGAVRPSPCCRHVRCRRRCGVGRSLGNRGRCRLRSIGGRNGVDAVGAREAEHFAGIDPVRILHDARVHAIDVGPEERIAAIVLGEIPERIALTDRVGLGRGGLSEDQTRGQGQGEQAYQAERTGHQGLPATSVSDMEMANRERFTGPGGANSTPVRAGSVGAANSLPRIPLHA